MSGQKTRHQRLNSYFVMNSLGDINMSTQQRYDLKADIQNIYVRSKDPTPEAK